MSRMAAAGRLGLAALGCAWAIAAAQAPETGISLRRSGFESMGPELQAMQRDESLNPGMLWVLDGEALWQSEEPRDAGQARRSCAGCHGQAWSSMRGVATRYPALDARLARPLDLSGRINLCRTRHQQADAWAPEAAPLLALEAWVAMQSRGLPLAPPADPALLPYRERGAALFRKRLGQLDLSCADCHDAMAGKRLGGNPIPPGDPTPYPAYRLQWQNLGSLQRRIRNCMTGVRAEPLTYGGVEMIELSLHLALRARGLAIEAPGVRP
jgi:L-cysteine S-thiosulfotransferase